LEAKGGTRERKKVMERVSDRKGRWRERERDSGRQMEGERQTIV
jgi:hypothetical protein